jgi:hypothetical protein
VSFSWVPPEGLCSSLLSVVSCPAMLWPDRMDKRAGAGFQDSKQGDEKQCMPETV